MSSCEKCWADSKTMTKFTKESQVKKYRELIKSRNCTPEEQAGPNANECFLCKRKTLHQYTNRCMNKNCNDLKTVIISIHQQYKND
jgi:hypothetical protein